MGIKLRRYGVNQAIFTPKTPDFSRQNIRTFKDKHRNFVSKTSDVFSFPAENTGKHTENGLKTLMLHFCDISNKDFPVGFRRPSQAVTDTSKAAAWRLPERRKKNCTLFHTQHFSSWIFFNTIPEMTSARHTVEPPFSVLKTGNRKKIKGHHHEDGLFLYNRHELRR